MRKNQGFLETNRRKVVLDLADFSGKTCLICNNINRAQIDAALLNGEPIEDVAHYHRVAEDELKMHAMLHVEDDHPSITAQLKLREADMLTAVAEEYMQTLVLMGERIRSHADADLAMEKLLTKSVVDLYLGVGSEIRHTVKALADLNSVINGDATGARSGLASLAEAINNSVRAIG